ncbi:nicotinate-nucleotide--dimethylbenzimidazole phosphoribosyltransferase [Streptococcus catagoni]|uniref:nicotinate-nucleotide--dimethylbenzimidazole phosphoribosyltransferase n=1 Tax=Streptococcus catagoni TaxID=2654874 RepID=UPI001409DB4B|nr:nicotinate-nucleotide--dimethylbenzimidazole phosphoribosyltransferase [Streptococcus catagoni]
MISLDDILKDIKPIDRAKEKEGQAYCDSLAKPLGSLGKMEKIYAKLFAMFEGEINLTPKVVMVYSADNGVVAEKISANPQETTYQVSENILAGKTGLCAISQELGSDIYLIDIGCKKNIFSTSESKVMAGTHNMLEKPAMSAEDCIKAILVGYEKTQELIKEGYSLFGTGEMGIGNTTTSAAVISAILELAPEEVTGYGAGLTEPMKAHKIAVIKAAIKKHSPFKDVLDIVAKVGGLDMLGIAGTFLACAQAQLPCVVDGLISVTGLLIASQLCSHVLDYSFASHVSTEPGYDKVSQYLGLEPMLMMDMRLGEGSGCPLAFSLIETSVSTIRKMPTFSQTQLNKEDYIDIRKG